MKKLILFILFILFILVGFAYGASQQTSSTAASELINDAEALLNDSENRFWRQSELLQWLNDGMVDIVSRSHCLQSTESINLATDTLEYTITSNYITVKAVHYIDSDGAVKALRRGGPDRVGLVEDVDEPVYFYDWAGKLGIYPTFTRTTETVTVYLITRPTAITVLNNVTTPAIYDTALTYYMVAQAHLKALKHAKYLQSMALYDAEMNRLRQDLNESAKDKNE